MGQGDKLHTFLPLVSVGESTCTTYYTRKSTWRGMIPESKSNPNTARLVLIQYVLFLEGSPWRPPSVTESRLAAAV